MDQQIQLYDISTLALDTIVNELKIVDKVTIIIKDQLTLVCIDC